jgi:hypothetical protein
MRQPRSEGKILFKKFALNYMYTCEEGLSAVVEPPTVAAKQFCAILENSWHPVLLPVSRREFHPVVFA